MTKGDEHMSSVADKVVDGLKTAVSLGGLIPFPWVNKPSHAPTAVSASAVMELNPFGGEPPAGTVEPEAPSAPAKDKKLSEAAVAEAGLEALIRTIIDPEGLAAASKEDREDPDKLVVDESDPMAASVHAFEAKFAALGSSDKPLTSQSGPERILATKQAIAEIEKQMFQVVDLLAKNPSIISRLSTSWGESSLLKKITTGAGLTLAPLVPGIAASIPALMITGGVIAGVYTTVGLLLDDNYRGEGIQQDSLKKGTRALAKIFENVVVLIEQVKDALAAEVAKMTSENERLQSSIDRLLVQCDGFRSNNEMLKESLSQLKDERDKAKAATDILQGTVSGLIASQTENAALQERWHKFLEDKESSFAVLASSRVEADRKLDEAVTRLENSEARFSELEKRYEALHAKLSVDGERVGAAATRFEEMEARVGAVVAASLTPVGATPQTLFGSSSKATSDMTSELPATCRVAAH